MSFAPEDGTGLSGANAFFDLEPINEYHSLRRNVEWAAADEDDQKAAIVLATDWIATRDVTLRGEPANGDQSLPFPRSYPDSNGVVGGPVMPALLLRATAELALIALSRPLFNRSAPVTQGSMIEDKTDVLTTKWAPVPVETLNSQESFSFIMDILAPLLTNAGGGFTLKVLRG